MPIDPKFFTEQIEKQNRNRTLYDQFNVTPKISSLANKFYARHEVMDLKKTNPQILKEILAVKSFTPQQKFKRPVTTSHSYGWYSTPLVKIDRSDRRFYRPNTTNPIVKVGSLINAEKVTARPKFTGISFKL